MKISDTIRVLLIKCGKKQLDLVKPLGMKSAASLNNKFSYDRWDAKDLVRVAEAVGCRVGFKMQDGEWLLLDNDQYVEVNDNAKQQ